MNIMMILGVFPFMTSTAAFEKMQRSFEYSWAEQNRLPHPTYKYWGIGGPALQYQGPGTYTISIDGAIFPGQKGMATSLAILRAMANTGIPLPLLSFSGFILGRWVIKKIDETRSEFVRAGPLMSARKIEFSLTLQRYVEFKPWGIVI